MTLKFDWQDAIFDSDLPSTTKLVLLAIARRMKADGSDAYPSTLTIAKDASLTERAVITHLEKAEQLGWIVRQVRGVSGQGWKRHSYQPAFPKGTEARSVRTCEGTEPHSKGTERRSV